MTPETNADESGDETASTWGSIKDVELSPGVKKYRPYSFTKGRLDRDKCKPTWYVEMTIPDSGGRYLAALRHVLPDLSGPVPAGYNKLKVINQHLGDVYAINNAGVVAVVPPNYGGVSTRTIQYTVPPQDSSVDVGDAVSFVLDESKQVSVIALLALILGGLAVILAAIALLKAM